jgi:quercetin dioxygenase-like cupin family protein
MPENQAAIQVRRWSGGQHPSMSAITRLMHKEGLRPYMWVNTANQRHAVRSHGYNKILYVVEGSLELTLPDLNKSVKLRGGDRVDIPAGVRHGAVVGNGGAKCMEASESRVRVRR